jgi:glyoxylase-like metal-dependent hydrolase (beta-lactamase superfamily II)
MHYEIIRSGFPGSSSRGFLGWSTIVLLHTERGPVLFDTGAAGDRPSLLAALRERGIVCDDVVAVVLSHLHFDHVGNVECFPRAELVLHQAELAYFRENRGRDPALPVFLVEGMLANCELTLVHDEIALFRDVQLIHTPGHTAGHCSLLLQAGDVRVALAQDAIKHRGEAKAGRPTQAFDLDSAALSIARLLRSADIIIPGHDAELSVADGEITATGSPREEIGVALNGRTIGIEA